jgi:hypothetical protein
VSSAGSGQSGAAGGQTGTGDASTSGDAATDGRGDGGAETTDGTRGGASPGFDSAAGAGMSGAGGEAPVGELAQPPCANLARNAAVEAQSIFPGYALAHVTDGDRSTTLGSEHSWSNDNEPPDGKLPQWFDLDFGRPRAVSRVELYTSEDYIIQDYDLLYWDETAWRTILTITGNPVLHRTHEFPMVATSRLRILCRRGPTNQSYYARLNEVEVYSTSAAQCPGGDNAGEKPFASLLVPTRRAEAVELADVNCEANNPRWSPIRIGVRLLPFDKSLSFGVRG